MIETERLIIRNFTVDDWKAHSAYVHKVKDVLAENGFRIENEKEVSNFSHRL